MGPSSQKQSIRHGTLYTHLNLLQDQCEAQSNDTLYPVSESVLYPTSEITPKSV